MAPRKRKQTSGEPTKKRMTKADREKLICKKKLDALEIEESLAKEDRFDAAERERLLDAYNESGFQVFQDMKLLQRYFPNRRENDLKGLVQRLRSSLQANSDDDTADVTLDEWQKLCQNLMGSFARDKKANFDDALADALTIAADDINPTICDNNEPNNPDLLRSFAQLLRGKFPDNMTPANAAVSMKLFEHINGLLNSINVYSTFPSLADGRWLESANDEARRRQEMALKGLGEIDGLIKKCPTLRDIRDSSNIEALCLELPKIKRITEVLNPLHIDESLASTLMDL